MDNYEKIKEYEAHKTPVPSYEEWQAKLEENAQLKELLRECLSHLTIGKYGTSVTPINILCDEVEEVLK